MKHKMSVVVLLCFVSLMIIAFESKGEEIESLISRLGEKSYAIRHKAVEDLVQIGDPTVPALIDALKDPNHYVRAEAAYVLGQIGGPAKSAVPSLIAALRDESSWVHDSAALALKQVGVKQVDVNMSMRPPLSLGRIAGEIAVGAGGGLIGLLAGARIGQSSGYGIGIAIVGTITGFTLGCSLGVYLVGNIGNETGSFLATWGGSILGGVPAYFGVVIGYGAVAGDGDVPDWAPLVGLGMLSQSTGATIGFNLTRRYESPPTAGNALLNFDEGQVRLAVPTILFRLDPYDRGNFTQSVNLVKVRF
ncbi:HEAT repeat domain-containing protein [Candidatus Poribacteria bacterium]|nr:HEAT repeat domain-containing protein [Candidatus Poribacteria bacterium]